MAGIQSKKKPAEPLQLKAPEEKKVSPKKEKPVIMVENAPEEEKAAI